MSNHTAAELRTYSTDYLLELELALTRTIAAADERLDWTTGGAAARDRQKVARELARRLRTTTR